MKHLIFYLLLGLAAGLLLFFFTQRIATNLKASLQTLQEQQLIDQMDYLEQPEAYQPTREQLRLIESYSDIITEREADYLETMGHHSPEIRDQFPHAILTELWDIIYDKELDYFHKHDELSQRILDQLKESREQAEAIERLFGNLEEQSKCQ